MLAGNRTASCKSLERGEYVARSVDPVEERVDAEPACDRRPATGQQRRSAGHVPLTWDSGGISRLWSSSVISKPSITAPHMALRFVVEHDALRAAGRTTCVDEQRCVVGVLRACDPGVGSRGRVRDGRNGCTGIELQRGLGVSTFAAASDLIAHLGPVRGRVDRGDCRADAPRREQRHHETRCWAA